MRHTPKSPTRPLRCCARLSALLPGILLAACSAAPLAVPDDVPVWRQGVELAEPSHVGWNQQNEPFGKDFRWRVGDRVLYALTRDNQGDIQKRLIEIRVEALAPPFERQLVGGPRVEGQRVGGKSKGARWSHIFFYPDQDGKQQSLKSMSMQVRVMISDESGKELSTSTSDVPEAYLRMGFFGGCKVGAGLRTRRQYRKDENGKLHLRAPVELYEAVASLQALFSVVASSASLRPIIEDVIEKPPLIVLLPALLGGGISISVAPDIMAARTAEIPGHDGVEGYSFPISFSINDYPGLYARVLVAPPDELAPLGAGIVAVEGRHPSHKDIWLSMRLLGSRRGPLPAASR